ncbi:flagellar M-ring protein FliF [Vibrio astriarenae]|uniref:Flagellar M-ring protein n=1 Tax=Vibrio astriarenae TaxID=1481923 RepID=A0A7Z2YEW3_9VIBR|nr:flagellar basal-body MS-ring/collar protein FliF [Vibrio astriarenae]QIA64549.1 flagellar M-ring protein FliF [Vibrio astriarenae]
MSVTTLDSQTNEAETPARWKQWQQKITEFKSSHHKAFIIAILAALITLFIVAILWTKSVPYRALYGEAERYDSAEILDVLTQVKIAYKIDNQTGQVLVPENKLADARITLAAHGVKAQLPQGLDILDKATGLGTSQFIENARYRQGLEGELARTILAINVVNNARVHLAIPNRTLFVGINEEKPSAAVMVELLPGRTLEQQQVEAIVNLVSGSITGMPAEGVSVVDQHGNLLSADIRDGNQARMSVQYHEIQQRTERDIVHRATDMLTPLLGMGNFRVQVSATLNFDQIEETAESLEGDPVVRSEFSLQDNSQGQLALGIPGALSNQAPVEGEQANNESRNERAENSRQYDFGRKVRHTKMAQGGIEHLSVSVLLNDSVSEQGWQQAELEQIAQMVKDSVGYIDERGDQFSLHAFNFAREPEVVADPMPWWHQQHNLVLIQYGLYALITLSFIFFVLRPLIKTLSTSPSERSIGESHTLAVSTSAASLAAAPSPAAIPSGKMDSDQDLADALIDSMMGGGSVENEMEGSSTSSGDLYDLPPLGSDLEVQVEHLQKLTAAESERVADVVKKWVNSNES